MFYNMWCGLSCHLSLFLIVPQSAKSGDKKFFEYRVWGKFALVVLSPSRNMKKMR